MAKKNNEQSYSNDYSAIILIAQSDKPCQNTPNWFVSDGPIKSMSAIDQFMENCRQITKCWITDSELSPEMSRLVLMGYVSAVESFIRTIIRDIINFDHLSQVKAHGMMIQYGAALYHDRSILPEALIEAYSFAGQDGIKKTFNAFFELNLEKEWDENLMEYERICQLRHCCVHRFGKLGAKNGIVLGLGEHRNVLEEPLALSAQDLENLAFWLTNFVGAINNRLFQYFLDRSVNTKNPYRTSWAWVYSRDKRKFDRFYQIFSVQNNMPKSPSAKELYVRFKESKKEVSIRNSKK